MDPTTVDWWNIPQIILTLTINVHHFDRCNRSQILDRNQGPKDSNGMRSILSRKDRRRRRNILPLILGIFHHHRPTIIYIGIL
jgi:hypothetical protein